MGYLGAGRLGEKSGRLGDFARNKEGDGRLGSKIGEVARQLRKYAGAPIWEQGDWPKISGRLGDSDPHIEGLYNKQDRYITG